MAGRTRRRSIPPVKVFVYTEREVPSLKLLMPPKDSPVLKTGICGQKMYGTQVHVHRFLLSAKHVRTMNPDEADFFYVPGWPKCMLDAPPNGAGVSPETLSKRYVAVIRSLPYFQRSDGRDHIFLWPSGRGPTLFKDWKCHAPNSLFITPEGHYTSPYRDMAPYYDPWKDVVIPGFMDGRKDTYAAQNKPSAKRRMLASFAGTVPDDGALAGSGLTNQHPRSRLVQLAKKYPPEVLSAHSGRTPQYAQLLTDARFCLVPRGLSPWTLRMYETFFAGCVPVIISDAIRLPFQEFIDYSRVSIKWPEARIGDELIEYLKSIPVVEVEAMRRRGGAVRCLFAYQAAEDECNAFSATMWALSLKRRSLAGGGGLWTNGTVH